MHIFFAGILIPFYDLNLDDEGLNKRCKDRRQIRYNNLSSIITHLKVTPAKPQKNE